VFGERKIKVGDRKKKEKKILNEVRQNVYGRNYLDLRRH
jgi:hypothetical protein